MELYDVLQEFTLNETQLQQLNLYSKLLIQWNQKFNLTAITDTESIYLKHFYDCLLLAKNYPIKGNLLDIGSGAGFPGIVLKIYNPQLSITLSEPNNKKISFLNEVINQLDLKDICVTNLRAEEIEEKESFDYITARAVSALNILLELAIPLLKVQGHFLAMKGPKAYQEIEQAANGFKMLKCHLLRCDNYQYQDNTRIILDIVKTEHTDIRYPRHYSQIVKKPL